MAVDQGARFRRLVRPTLPSLLRRGTEGGTVFGGPVVKGDALFAQHGRGLVVFHLEGERRLEGQLLHGNLDDTLQVFRQGIPGVLANGQMVGGHGVEARIGRVLDQVVETDRDVVGQTGIVRTVDDSGFHSSEDLGEVHHDWASSELSEDLGLEARGRAELPVLQVGRAGNRLGGGHGLLAVDPPADELHVVLVVKRVGRLFAAAIVEPGVLLPGRVIATHDVADELEGRVLAGLVGATGHVAVEDAAGRRVEGLDRLDHRGGEEHLDIEATAGHGLHVVDELLGQLSRSLFGGVVGLDTQRVFGCHGRGKAKHRGRRRDGGDFEDFH